MGKFSKYCLLAGIFLLKISFAQSQVHPQIFEAEYFFDLDPGFGSATPITIGAASSTISIPSEILTDASSLSLGFHVLGVRVRNVAENPTYDVNGDASELPKPFEMIDASLRPGDAQWGMTETRLIYVDASDLGSVVNIDQIEYFFDTDPGVGSATQIGAFTAANNISIPSETLDASGLSTGFHVLGMRGRTEGGEWGITETRVVFIDQSDISSAVSIDQIEYFFDVDPGAGSATPVTAFTAGNNIMLASENLNASSLSNGFHVLGMRARTEGGEWGITETRLLYIDPSNVGGVVNVDQIEYFFDEDPGVGSATLITSFTAGNVISIVEALTSNTLSAGFHILGMRARAQGGAWGTTETRLIVVDQAGVMSDVTEFEYFFDEDPGVGAAANVVVTTPGLSVNEEFLVNSDTLSLGTHEFFVRAKNQDGVWGLAESQSFDVGDVAAPLITSLQAQPPTVDSLDMTITFGEGVNSFDESDIVVTGNASIRASTFTTVNDSSYTFVLDLLSPDTILIDIADSAAFANDNGSPTPPAETFEIFYELVTPDVTFTTIDVPSANLAQGTTDNLVYQFSVAASGGAVDQQGLIFTVGAGSATSDFSNDGWKVYESVNVDAGVGGATLVATSNIGEVLTDTLLFSLSSTVADGDIHYFYVTADIDAAAVHNNSFNVVLSTPDPLESFGIQDPKNKVDGGFVDGNVFTIVDVTAPLISINTPISGDDLLNGGEAFGVIVSGNTEAEDGQVVTVTFDDAANPTVQVAASVAAGVWTTPLADVSGLNEGPITVSADVSDLAGNPAITSSETITLDRTLPLITVDLLVTSITSPSLTGTVDDLTSVIDVTVDGSNYFATNNGDGTWELAAGLITPSLGEGTYEVVAAATDAAGNVGADTSNDELVITTTILSLDASDVTSTGFTARWSQAEDVQSYALEISDTPDFSTFLAGYDPLVTGADQTSEMVTGLDFGTRYYYRVRFTNTSDEESSDSNVTSVRTEVDAETLADSTALVEILMAVGPEGQNWESARLRDWTGITLDASRTRVSGIDIGSTNASGDLPNPFSGAVLADNGLSDLTSFDAADNGLTGLIDFASTSIASVSVENNSLTFEDLEPVAAQNPTTFTYGGQANVVLVAETNADFIKDTQLDRLGVVRIAPKDADYTLLTGLGGTNNSYSWTRDGSVISTGTLYSTDGANLTILSIGLENMGLFGATVSNSTLPDLLLTVVPEYVFAVVDVTMNLTDENDALLDNAERFTGALLETVLREGSSGYDTLDRTATLVPPLFTFEDVILGDYLCGIDPENEQAYVPTYFGDAFTWEDADTIEIREATTLSIRMTDTPPDETGPGNLDVVIEEDFGDEEARVETRRRAKKRKCGLRRRRTGGRTGQDDAEFELFAYGETDDNGEFQFGFLPEGTYRFFVEYPGIPLDESSFVQFEVGELGISDTDFSLNAFATEDGVEVTIERVLGVILTYFKDLSVYPNPADEYIKVRYRHLKSTDVRAELVDLTGKTKWEADLRNGYDGQLDIDIRDLQAGVYILRFYDRNSRQENVVSYRIVVK